jgi:hypothetical protein
MNTLPSAHQLGASVEVNFLNAGKITNCKVIKIHFTEATVSYDLEIEMFHPHYKESMYTRLYNIESSLVTAN